MPRVSETHLAARRQQILDAARACFLRNGLHHTSMQDLIREADLSVGAVYRYFKSKHEIINAIAEDVAGGLTRQLEALAATDPPLPLTDVMARVLDLIDDQLAPDGNFGLALHVWSEAALDPAIGAVVRRRYTAMRAAFITIARRAVESGELPPDTDDEAVAAALYSLIPGYGLQRLLTGTPDKATYLRGVRTLLAGPYSRGGAA